MTNIEQELVKKCGKKKAEFMLEAVGKDQDFITAINTTLGKELVGGWLDDWKMLLGKIVNGKATEEERVGFIVIDQRLTDAAERIAKHYQYKKGIENAVQ